MVPPFLFCREVSGHFVCHVWYSSLRFVSFRDFWFLALARAYLFPGGDSTPPWWLDADACLEYLFRKQHPSTSCPQCQRSSQYYRTRSKGCYTCACGRSHIYPKKGTVFESSPLSLPTWFLAVWFLSGSEASVKPSSLARLLGVSAVTAARMLKVLEPRRPKRGPVTFERYLEQCLR